MSARQTNFEQALKDGYLDLHHWAEHTKNLILKNFGVRNIFPMGFPGPYAGYQEVNEKRKKTGKWFSTKQAYNSLYTKCYAASNGSTEKIDFFFMQYLRFVDAGVGKYQHYKGTKKAQFNKELSPWGTSKRKKRVQRPFLNIEIRHQITRLRRIAIRYYQHDIGGVFGLLISEKKK